MTSATLIITQFEVDTEGKQQEFKTYKRRWLILAAMFTMIVVGALHKSIISIANIVGQHMDMTDDQYSYLTQVSMFTNMVSVLFMARAIEHFGLMKMARIACAITLTANGLKAVCCADELYVPDWIKDYRFVILVLSEVFLGLAQATTVCMSPKVASTWFPYHENTRALVIANGGYNIGVGVSNYFVPMFVHNAGEVFKLSQMFIISGILMTVIVLACITQSSPKLPPSAEAVVSESNEVSLKRGSIVMLTNPSFVLLMLNLSFSVAILNNEHLVQESILRAQHYSNTFCGTLIAHAYILGIFFMLVGATWIDKSADYVRASRMISIIYAVGLVSFNMSVLTPNIEYVILFTNIFSAFGHSMVGPALFQVSLRSAVSVLPVATVAAINILTYSGVSGIMMTLLNELKRLSPAADPYRVPLIASAIVVVIMNVLYVTMFRTPKREELQRKLRSSGNKS